MQSKKYESYPGSTGKGDLIGIIDMLQSMFGSKQIVKAKLRGLSTQHRQNLQPQDPMVKIIHQLQNLFNKMTKDEQSRGGGYSVMMPQSSSSSSSRGGGKGQAKSGRQQS